MFVLFWKRDALVIAIQTWKTFRYVEGNDHSNISDRVISEIVEKKERKKLNGIACVNKFAVKLESIRRNCNEFVPIWICESIFSSCHINIWTIRMTGKTKMKIGRIKCLDGEWMNIILRKIRCVSWNRCLLWHRFLRI